MTQKAMIFTTLSSRETEPSPQAPSPLLEPRFLILRAWIMSKKKIPLWFLENFRNSTSQVLNFPWICVVGFWYQDQWEWSVQARLEKQIKSSSVAIHTDEMAAGILGWDSHRWDSNFDQSCCWEYSWIQASGCGQLHRWRKVSYFFCFEQILDCVRKVVWWGSICVFFADIWWDF